jgi:hypothetical protein
MLEITRKRVFAFFMRLESAGRVGCPGLFSPMVGIE